LAPQCWDPRDSGDAERVLERAGESARMFSLCSGDTGRTIVAQQADPSAPIRLMGAKKFPSTKCPRAGPAPSRPLSRARSLRLYRALSLRPPSMRDRIPRVDRHGPPLLWPTNPHARTKLSILRSWISPGGPPEIRRLTKTFYFTSAVPRSGRDQVSDPCPDP